MLVDYTKGRDHCHGGHCAVPLINAVAKVDEAVLFRQFSSMEERNLVPQANNEHEERGLNLS